MRKAEKGFCKTSIEKNEKNEKGIIGKLDLCTLSVVPFVSFFIS